MNYYERHLGDYAKDTAHLSMIEHGAYTLILDRYYSTEQGIPADQVYRVTRARAKEEKAAVDVVLEEFFTLTDGVWVKNRVQEAIEKFLESEPDREAKKENDKERQRRSRERRKALFDQLRSHAIVPAWDTKTSDLEFMLLRAKSANVTEENPVTVTPVTPPVTEPVTRDNTATQPQPQPPIPNNHSPIPNTQYLSKTTDSGSEKELLVDVGGDSALGGADASPSLADAQATTKAKRLPADWVLPKALGEWSLANFPAWTAEHVRVEAEKFKDFWISKSGKDATKVDWPATWRNWCRNSRGPVVARPAYGIKVPQNQAEYEASKQSVKDGMRRILGIQESGDSSAIDVETREVS